MCKYGSYKKVKVWIPADLSCTGRAKYKLAKIDSCIADIVKALAKSNIKTRGSCCGHNKTEGNIELQDGRVLLILPKVNKYMVNKRRKNMGNNMAVGVNLNDTMDAKIWAEEFNKTLVKLEHQPLDVGWLIGWFANAIMAGYDNALRKANKNTPVNV